MSDEFFRTEMGRRFYANIEALVAELGEQRRKKTSAERATDSTATEAERHG